MTGWGVQGAHSSQHSMRLFAVEEKGPAPLQLLALVELPCRKNPF